MFFLPVPTAAPCSVVCSEPGAIGLWEILSLGGSSSVPDIPGGHWNSLPNGVPDVRQCDFFSSQCALLTAPDGFNRRFLHFGGAVPIMGMGLAGEFEGGQYTASLLVNCQNIFLLLFRFQHNFVGEIQTSFKAVGVFSWIQRSRPALSG